MNRTLETHILNILIERGGHIAVSTLQKTLRKNGWELWRLDRFKDWLLDRGFELRPHRNMTLVAL